MGSSIPHFSGLKRPCQPLSAERSQPAGPRVLTLAQLLATPEPATRYAAAPIIPAPGISLIAGYAGAFKTWAVAGLALSLAQGLPFLSKFGVPAPLSVLFIAAEMSGAQLAHRFRLLGVASACERLRLVVDQGLDLYGAAHRDWLLQREEEVVVLDPAIRLFKGDENSAPDVARFFEPLLALKRAGKAVVLVHHVRKAVPGAGPSDPDAMIRGSGDWKAAVDSALVVKRLGEQRVQVWHVKLRDGREVPPFIVRIDGDEERVTLTYEGEAEKTLPGLVPVREAIMSMLASGMRGPSEVIAALRGRYAEKAVRGTIRSLVEEGAVERVMVGRRVFLNRNGHGPAADMPLLGTQQE